MGSPVRGKGYVVKAGATFELLASNDLGGGATTAAPTVANGKIYVRDFDFL